MSGGEELPAAGAGSAWVSCSAFVGVYGVGLDREERARLDGRVALLARRFPGLRWQVRSGDRWAVAWAVPEARAAELPRPAPLRGGPVLGWSPVTPEDREEARLEGPDPLGVLGGLEGAWGAAWVDGRRGVLLGRDPAGAEAVYYRQEGGRLHFSSNLVGFNGLGWELDREAVAAFLHFLYIPAPRTIYRGTTCIPPGAILSFAPDRPAPLARSLPPRPPGPEAALAAASAEERLQRFEAALAAAVSRLLPHGAPAGLLLSGGKDSSAIAVGVRLAGLREVTAYTVGFADPRFDETEDGRVVAEHLGLPFVPLRFSLSEFAGGWEPFLRGLGQPLGDPASLSLSLAFRRMAERGSRILDGTGNDSYFGILAAGYEAAVWRMHRAVPGLHRLPWPPLPERPAYRLSVLLEMLRRPREEQFVSWLGWRTAEARQLTGLAADWRDTPLYRLYGDTASPLEHKTRTLCAIWEPEAAYRKTVQQAWAAGLRMAFPFLDPALAGLVRSLPREERYAGGESKRILRRLLLRHLPAAVLAKSKGSFIFPKGTLLAADDFRLLRETLGAGAVRDVGLVDWSLVEPFVRRYAKGQRRLEDRIWALAVLHGWAMGERAAAVELPAADFRRQARLTRIRAARAPR